MKSLEAPDLRVGSSDSIRLRTSLRDQIMENGYAIVRGADFLIPLPLHQSWLDFTNMWDDLSEDAYLRDAGFLRLRRYSRLLYDPLTDEMSLLPSADYYQSESVNPLFDGIVRRFEPLHPSSLRSPFLNELIVLDLKQLPASDAQLRSPWKIGVHQIRISCNGARPAMPTPEGIHRDSHSFVVMHLIARQNLLGGTSNIYEEECRLVQSITLSAALDSIFIDDSRVLHDVTRVEPKSRDCLANRDVLVLTYDCVEGFE